MKFHRILVAVDRSEAAQEVFRQALHLARPKESAIALLYCLPIGNPAELAPIVGTSIGLNSSSNRSMLGTSQQRLDMELEQVRDYLRQYCDRALDAGIDIKYACKLGDPGSLTCAYARDWQADLIVLGRRGRKGFQEAMLGSVSNYVLHHASCSVLVVQGRHGSS